MILVVLAIGRFTRALFSYNTLPLSISMTIEASASTLGAFASVRTWALLWETGTEKSRMNIRNAQIFFNRITP
jgi:hypothetical protein